MNAGTTNESLVGLLDEAERLLAQAWPAAVARAIVELARRGASLDATPQRRTQQVGAHDDSVMLTTREVAAQLRVSEKQVYRLVHQGRLKRYGLGRSHRFRAPDIAALLRTSTDSVRAVRVAREAHERPAA